MRSHFFYKRLEPVQPTLTKEQEISSAISPPEYKEYTDSINMDMVVRSIGLEDGRCVLLLNDYHEAIRDVPIRNKQGGISGYKKDHFTAQSEIYLSAEDAARFFALTAVS